MNRGVDVMAAIVAAAETGCGRSDEHICRNIFKSCHSNNGYISIQVRMCATFAVANGMHLLCASRSCISARDGHVACTFALHCSMRISLDAMRPLFFSLSFCWCHPPSRTTLFRQAALTLQRQSQCAMCMIRRERSGDLI